MKYPFKQKKINDQLLIREFDKDVDASELVWHRDREDRVVRVLEGNDWLLQKDNQVPAPLVIGKSYYIPKHTYHRVMRGTSSLVVEIKKLGNNRKMKITKSQLRRIIREEAAKTTKKYDDDPALTGDQDELPDHLQKGIIDSKEMDEVGSAHPSSYGAPAGSKRGKQLDATKADLASGDPERIARAYRRRERMERQHSQKNESRLRKAIRLILSEALSKATEDKIRKAAERRGMTFGSMKAEYKKGLAAWGSSGSRPGVSQHAWAMARINKANPSDDWSVVKKSKAKA